MPLANPLSTSRHVLIPPIALGPSNLDRSLHFNCSSFAETSSRLLYTCSVGMQSTTLFCNACPPPSAVMLLSSANSMSKLESCWIRSSFL
eukprot:5870-Amphidinium_carterae.1